MEFPIGPILYGRTFRVSPNPKYRTTGYIRSLRPYNIPFGDTVYHKIRAKKEKDVLLGTLAVTRIDGPHIRVTTTDASGRNVSDVVVETDWASGVHRFTINGACEFRPIVDHAEIAPMIVKAAGFEFTRIAIDDAKKDVEDWFNGLRDVAKYSPAEKLAMMVTDRGDWYKDRDLVLKRLGFIYGREWVYYDDDAIESSTEGFYCADPQMLNGEPNRTYGINENGDIIADVIEKDMMWMNRYRWNLTTMRIISCESRWQTPDEKPNYYMRRIYH